MSRPRVAIAHDYLTQRGGAERVVLALARAFPDAVIHTTLYDPEGTYPDFAGREIRTSPLNRIGFLRRHHRAALPFLAFAARRVRVEADVVVASSSGWAHGFDLRAPTVVYCHNPARWLYQTDEYLGDAPAWHPKRLAVGLLGRWLRGWDQRAARSRESYLANSRVVRARIASTYGITAALVPPPYGIDTDGPATLPQQLRDWRAGGHLLVVSRLMPYKNVDAVVEAVRETGHRLAIVGDGPERARLQASLPDNVRLLSGVSDAELRWLYSHARALLAPSREDFGLTPLEAAAYGVPTLALRAGGYLDTVVERGTGLFFDSPDPTSIAAVCDRLDATRPGERVVWDPEAIRAHAATFSEERFAQRIREEIARITPGFA